MRVDLFKRAKVTVQELSHHFSEPRFVLREAGGINGVAARAQFVLEQADLCVLSAAVNAFNCDELSELRHTVRNGLFDSLTGDARSRNAACYDENFKMSAQDIRENLERVRERIARAAERGGRRAEEITLIGVSKTRPAADIRDAFEAGLIHFGENRVQEWEGKRGEIANLPCQWHLIGHLQSNKAARAAKLFHSVDSVDDARLAERLDRAYAETGQAEKLRVLIEVHIANEETKSGSSIENVPQLAEQILKLPNLRLAGVMCIPPFLENIDQVRPYFRKLRELRRSLQEQLKYELPVLSMGMSHDFEVAIEEGATEVRIGTALFGARTKQ